MKRSVEQITDSLKRVREQPLDKREFNQGDEYLMNIKDLKDKTDDMYVKEVKGAKEDDTTITADISITTTTTITDTNIDTIASSKSIIKYRIDGPFQRVDPYWFDYCSWAKGRWFKNSLISVFRREFRDRPAEYYAHACRAGLIRVNDSVVGEDYVVRQGDRIQHRIHRHEPPVLAEPTPEILHVGEGFLVVSKPASIPMHPSGRYRHNTLTSILLHLHPQLFPSGHISCVNRLDRLVSGIVILARSAEKADELRRAMQELQFRKFYLARVKGDFSKLQTGTLPFASSPHTHTVDCRAALLIVEHKLGLSCVADASVHPAAKSSHTRFRHLHYDPQQDFSVVLCEPVTGRTHQIRLHLQYLRHPIHNDPLYNNHFWNRLLDSKTLYSSNDWIDRVKEMAQDLSKSSLFLQEEEGEINSDTTNRFTNNRSSASMDSLCPDCENPLPDPDPFAMQIDLHAYKYSGPMGTFSTSLPSWAADVDLNLLKTAEEAFGGE